MYLFLLVTDESFDFDNNRSPIILLIIKNELFQLYIKAVGNFCRGGWSITLYKCDQRTKYGTNNHSWHSRKDVSRPAILHARDESPGSKAFSKLETLLLNKF